MYKLTYHSLAFTLGLALASSAWAAKPGPADGAGKDSDHIPIQMTLRDGPEDGIRSDIGGAYVHEQQNVLCDLNTPGSVICNSTDFKRRTAERFLNFDLPFVGAPGPVAFRMTTTFCNVRDLEFGAPTTCNLNFRFEAGGETYVLRFDPNVAGATSVDASCTDPDAGVASGNQCQTFTLTTDGVDSPAAAFYRDGRRELELLDVVLLQVRIDVEILQ